MIENKLKHLSLALAGITVLNFGSGCVSFEGQKYTPTPTKTPKPPTETPTGTFTPTPTKTLIPKPTLAPTDIVIPTEAPMPTPTSLLTPTGTPFPTEAPTAIETPVPIVDFRVTKEQLLSPEEAGGNHMIMVEVVDAAGAPLDGIIVHGQWTGNLPPTGEKGLGRTELPLWRGGCDELRITGDVFGASFASGQTKSLCMSPSGIANEDLISAGYCLSADDCNRRKADNQLPDAHYVWDVVFQRGW